MAAPETPAPRSARITQRHTRRRRRIALISAGALVVVIGVVSVWFATSGNGRSIAAPKAPPTTTTSTTAPAPVASLVATTKVPQLQARAEASATASVVATFPNVTRYGLATTLLVVEQQPGWYKALLPMRPNGSTGWVSDQEVSVAPTTLHISISLQYHTLVFKDGNTEILRTQVAVGKDQTPTPLGLFYITDPIDLTAKPNGAYGAYALGISAYSDALKTFRGGPAQIAVHGDAVTSDPGQNLSNGCIRVQNDQILEIAKRATLGTPVEITA
jgi:lipoprotein-anchoring transpeptidase ErfK/SrfK